MMYQTEVAFPTPVRGASSYKYRVIEMFTQQIPYAFHLYRAWWYWLLSPWVFPFQIVYCSILLVELLLITVLFPIACVPFLRFFSYLAQAICFGLTFMISFIGLIPRTYRDNY